MWRPLTDPLQIYSGKISEMYEFRLLCEKQSGSCHLFAIQNVACWKKLSVLLNYYFIFIFLNFFIMIHLFIFSWPIYNIIGIFTLTCCTQPAVSATQFLN